VVKHRYARLLELARIARARQLPQTRRKPENDWRLPTALVVVLQFAAPFGAPERHAAFAQLARPAGHPTGILSAQDHRMQIPSDQCPWSSIGRINVVIGTSSR
jgi:hypothetical protein